MSPRQFPDRARVLLSRLRRHLARRSLTLQEYLAALDDLDSSLLHLVYGTRRVARLEVNAAASVDQKARFESKPRCVERCKLYAVVGGKAHQVQHVDATSAKKLFQAGRLAVAVVEEATVAVDRAVRTLANDVLDALDEQRRMELGAV